MLISLHLLLRLTLNVCFYCLEESGQKAEIVDFDSGTVLI
jgi:hypothetical protein